MHDPTSDNAKLSGLEAQLAALAPRDSLDRDHLMFAAGQLTAARRLRFANRCLAATSLAFGVIVVVLVAIRPTPNEFLTGPALQVNPAGNLAHADQVNQVPTLSDPASDNRGAGSRATWADGSTNFRLLQRFGRDVNATLAARANSAPQRKMDDNVSPPIYPRALLNQYLDDKQGRL
jgi:hypothetical protein